MPAVPTRLSSAATSSTKSFLSPVSLSTVISPFFLSFKAHWYLQLTYFNMYTHSSPIKMPISLKLASKTASHLCDLLPPRPAIGWPTVVREACTLQCRVDLLLGFISVKFTSKRKEKKKKGEQLGVSLGLV